MKQIKLLLIVLVPFFGFSQVELKGNVKDSIGAIAFANVILLNQANEIVSGTITDESGNFLINTSKGAYKLSVTFVGYEDYNKEVNIENDLAVGDILLVSKENSLDEVLLVSKKKIIERKVDRLVFNIENNPATSGGNALEALKVSPGLAVNGDQIAMIGKSGMRLMLDGRIVQLSGQELVSFLSTIPSDDIKSIEIITNPPAKYEAQGNSGLINLVYKKGRKNSWSNSTTLSYTQAIFSNYTVRNSFNYSKGKVKFLLSANGTTGDLDVQQDTKIDYSEGPWFNDFNQKWNEDNLSGRMMLDYDLSDKSTIGIQYLGSVANPDVKDLSVTSIFNNSNQVDSLLVSDGFSDLYKDNHSLNTHFKTVLDTLGRSISVDLDYFTFTSERERNISTENFLSNNESLGISFSNQNDTDQRVKNYSARIDVEHPLEWINLSYGAKVSFTDNEYRTNNFNTISGTPVIDNDLSNKFDYTENNQAIYINGSKSISDKIEVQLGLRLENTQTEGFSETLNQTNENDYTKLFPTFYISYVPNDNNSYSFNYGKRIDRPGFSQLNPARHFTNENSFDEGNPFLQPSFNDNLELSHTYKGKLTTNLFLSIETNGYGVVPSVNDETNQQFITHQNFYDLYSYGLSQFYSFNNISWWDNQNVLYLINYESKFFNKDINAQVQNGFRYYIATNNTFTLNESKTLRGQVNFWYSSAYKESLFDQSESYNLDIALKFDVKKSDLQFSLGVYDILNTSPNTLTSVINGIRQDYTRIASNRYFRASMIYNFGNKKKKVEQRDFGNEEEKGRTN